MYYYHITISVQELFLFQDGLPMSVNLSTQEVVIRCLLLCVACDLPAVRKLCGFLSYSARIGCSKCYKKFPGDVGARDYSGFDQSLWSKRTIDDHRQRIKQISQADTKQNRRELESSLGCRYSSLLQLPYFNPITMHIIDPMHNLFLGTAKKMLEVWQDHELLLKCQLLEIQNLVDTKNVPSDIGRIPHKIGSGFAGFTADHFKNWVFIYSIPTLFGILPTEHLECW